MEDNKNAESKRILAGKLYRLLDKEACFSDICGESDFEEYFESVLENYSIIKKER